LAFHFQIDADPDPADQCDPDPAFHVDPDPNLQFDPDPYPQRCWQEPYSSRNRCPGTTVRKLSTVLWRQGNVSGEKCVYCVDVCTQKPIYDTKR
jgi:hypothetical protein